MIITIFDSDKISGTTTNFVARIRKEPGSVAEPFTKARLLNVAFGGYGETPPTMPMVIKIEDLGVRNSYEVRSEGGGTMVASPIFGIISTVNDLIHAHRENFHWLKISDFISEDIRVRIQGYDGTAVSDIDASKITRVVVTLEFA